MEICSLCNYGVFTDEVASGCRCGCECDLCCSVISVLGKVVGRRSGTCMDDGWR